MVYTELLFPPRLIPLLANLRGEKWKSLVENIADRPVGNLERRAFVLFVARLTNCLSCQSDTWRAHQGCELCARQTVKKFRGTDDELIALFETSLAELKAAFGVE